MTVWLSHVWYEHGRVHSAVLVGWMISGGPYDGYVIVQLPGDSQTHRLVDSHGWHSDRLSAELEVASALRRIADAARDRAARSTEGE